MSNPSLSFWSRAYLALSICPTLSAAYAQDVHIMVTNPSAAPRRNEPVVIAWERIGGKLPDVDVAKLRLLDEQNRSLAFQIDDLDADRTPDEFVFSADFNPHQQRRFIFTPLADTLASPLGPLRTDVADFKRINGVPTLVDDDDGPGTLRSQSQYLFDGVGWESELVGYRLYLDERNAIDIQGKRIPGLQWKFIGSSGVDYQLDSYWGMDILHVGPALGIGGIGLWLHDSVAHPYKLDRRRCRVIARGPVRAVVRVDYIGWDIGGEKVNLTSLFSIFEGDRATEHRVILQNAESPKTIVTGIVKHPPGKVLWNEQELCLSTLGRQSRANDSLLMALNFASSSKCERAEDKYDHLVLINLQPERSFNYLISSVWQGETGRMWSKREIRSFLKGMWRRLNEPLGIQVH
jgi:hypothetical protein